MNIFENWLTPNVTTAVPISLAGIAYPTYSDFHSSVEDHSKRWLVNTHRAACQSNLDGPNPCYAQVDGKLYFHGEKGVHGDGSLLISKDEFLFANGMIIECSFSKYCTNLNGGGWANMGIYDHEGNYRSAGIRSDGDDEHYFNIWGPDLEANFSGQNSYSHIPIAKGSTNKYKIQFWFTGSLWRWDYFLNDTWVAGHEDPDTSYNMGGGVLGNKARLQIGCGGYEDGPGLGGTGAAVEGNFGSVSYHTW